MRKKKPEEHVNHERWLVSYADFITLLFAFFTTLYAISTVDAQKMGKMVTSMRASFDSSTFEAGSPTLPLSNGGSAAAPDLLEPTPASDRTQFRELSLRNLAELKANFNSTTGAFRSKKSLGSLKREIEALVGAEALKGKVRARIDSRGLVISVGELGFFPSGSAEMRSEGQDLLDTIATALVPLENDIRIEGHTDNVPISSSIYRSNWELSTARATSVISYLAVKFGFSPERLSAAGYAEYRPCAANETAEGRAANRRVDIIVMDPKYSVAEPR